MSTAPAQNCPVPCEMERDADGRLVGIGFASERAPGPDTKNIWLIAVDGSAHALRAVEAMARMASEMQACRLHLVNVQPWFSKEAAEDELAQRGWAATAEVRALLDAAGQPWQLHIVMGEAPAQIIALAGHLACCGIVIGSRGLGVTESLLLGSVAEKVMHTSKLPVLMVP